MKIPGSVSDHRAGFLAGAITFFLAACSGGSSDGGSGGPATSGGAGGTSGATTTGTTTGGGGSGGCDPAAAIAKGCGTIACHGGVMPPLLELVAPGVEARIVNVPASYEGVQSGACPMPPELIVNTADPMASLLVKKLDGTQTCGDQMPQVPILGFTDEEKACIRSWALGLAMSGGGGGM